MRVSVHDGATLNLVVRFRAVLPADLAVHLTSASRLAGNTSPFERVGKLAHFVVDLRDLVGAHPSLDVWVVVDGQRHPVPYVDTPSNEATHDGPIGRASAWFEVGKSTDGAAVLFARSQDHQVVASSVNATADGIRVRLESSPGSSIEQVEVRPRAAGPSLWYPLVGSEAEIRLVDVPVDGLEGPVYWDLYALSADGTARRVYADNGDLTNYGSAVSLPALTFRPAHSEAAYYVKPYFSAKGTLALRCGRWREKDVILTKGKANQ